MRNQRAEIGMCVEARRRGHQVRGPASETAADPAGLRLALDAKTPAFKAHETDGSRPIAPNQTLDPCQSLCVLLRFQVLGAARGPFGAVAKTNSLPHSVE